MTNEDGKGALRDQTFAKRDGECASAWERGMDGLFVVDRIVLWMGVHEYIC
jgi:hypothetical protein